jgi:hypothetical protein
MSDDADEIARWREKFELVEGVLTWRTDPSRSAAWAGKPTGKKIPVDGRALSALMIARALTSGRIDAVRKSNDLRLEGMPDHVTVGQGALRRALEEARRNSGLPLCDLMVLARQNDPFFFDTPAGHRDGLWLKAQFERLLDSTSITHWRGVHYVLVAAGDVIKPNGKPYHNTSDDYLWLIEDAAKALLQPILDGVRDIASVANQVRSRQAAAFIECAAGDGAKDER